MTAAQVVGAWDNVVWKSPMPPGDDTRLTVVDIAHSMDFNGHGGTDAPGPHLGTYSFDANGRRLGFAEVQLDEKTSDGRFTEFRRMLVRPAEEES